ncbi:Acetylcholine receptor subunit alpha-type des-2 [Aphelenchoides fujianensis]|nr:Acetylcholine receptor subunit alpha-type des-2 [Aphelenchoides fujianensis]
MSSLQGLFTVKECSPFYGRNYEGATEVFLPSSKIWLPELSLYYSVNFNTVVNLVSNNDARVNYTGHFFPFDMQSCVLMFGSWAHSNESITFSLFSHNLSLIDFYDNQEWQLDLVATLAYLRSYVPERNIFNLVLPSCIIVTVAVIGFHTPSTSARVRDAKFRLGIMTLMSMSAVSVAIVQEVPKFSLSGNRKSRGSFSGIPLIALYYFMLLVIVGCSTISTSAFVFLERDFRQKRRIPWYLRWLSFDIRLGYRSTPTSFPFRSSSADPSATDALLTTTTNAGLTPQIRVNGFVGEGSGRQTRAKQYAQSVALSLLKLIPNEDETQQPGNERRQPNDVNAAAGRTNANARQRRAQTATIPEQNDAAGYPHTFFNPNAQEEPSPPLRRQFRKRLSLAHYDNLLLYQYFGQQLEELGGTIREGVKRMIPQEDLNSRWQTVIRRLELISLAFYMSLLFATTFLFFYHDWYCAVGNSPCGTANLKCPWIQSPPCTRQAQSTGDEHPVRMAAPLFVDAQMDFAVGLLRETAAHSSGSLILSPISIALALSLAYAGAGGETRKEFESVFVKGGTRGDALHSLFHQTLTHLAAGGKNVSLELANRAYAAHDLDVKAAYRELITANYGGDFKQVDFGQSAAATKEINDFVANVTHQKIRDLLKPGAVNDRTKLVLVNAVYFKGTWKKQFNKKATCNKKFFIKMMRMKAKVNYAETADVQVVELPYADERAKFIAFLPKKRFGIGRWLRKLNAAELLKLSARLNRREVNIELPRFKITSEFGLEEVLSKLGFSKGFSERADFSGIANNVQLMISQAVHKAFIETNEEGSEAAAATGLTMHATSFDPHKKEPVEFVADHPFAFLVVYGGNPLFFGRFIGS